MSGYDYNYIKETFDEFFRANIGLFPLFESVTSRHFRQRNIGQKKYNCGYIEMFLGENAVLSGKHNTAKYFELHAYVPVNPGMEHHTDESPAHIVLKNDKFRVVFTAEFKDSLPNTKLQDTLTHIFLEDSALQQKANTVKIDRMDALKREKDDERRIEEDNLQKYKELCQPIIKTINDRISAALATSLTGNVATRTWLTSAPNQKNKFKAEIWADVYSQINTTLSDWYDIRFSANLDTTTTLRRIDNSLDLILTPAHGS